VTCGRKQSEDEERLHVVIVIVAIVAIVAIIVTIVALKLVDSLFKKLHPSHHLVTRRVLVRSYYVLFPLLLAIF
jgi:hypothetical protein